MPKYLILGDVHLGKGLSLGKPGSNGDVHSRIQDQLDLLNFTLSQAKANSVKDVFITGDVFEEPRPHPTLIRLFILWLKACEKEKINIHIIVGNHDIIRSGSYSSSALDIVPAIELPYANVYKNPTTLNFDDISFTLLPYRDRRMLDAASPKEAFDKIKLEFEPEIAKATGKTKVCIGHFAIEGSFFVGDEIDDTLNEIFMPPDTFSDFDYTWMGHVHNPQVLSKTPYVAHIGSMDRSDFHKNEIEFDKILILIDENGFKEITLPTRKLVKLTIEVPDGKDSTDFVMNELHVKDLAGSIVKLEITLSSPALPNVDRDKLSKFLLTNMLVQHIVNISESRILQPIAIKTKTIDNNVTTTMAINSFADTIVVENEADREDFRKLALECYEEFLE